MASSLLLEQALANGVTIVYSFVVTGLLMLALKATIGVRVPDDVEQAGLDLPEHAEQAYHDDIAVGRSDNGIPAEVRTAVHG